MHDDEVEVSDVLVHRLLAEQLPHPAGRPLVVVEPWGTDHGSRRTSRWRSPSRWRSGRREEALAAAPQDGEPVWVHADLEGNCFVRNARLCGIVDWGSACAGDPAVDVQVVWSPLFTADSRRAFLDALEVDDATLVRSRGAAINQACAALPYYLHTRIR